MLRSTVLASLAVAALAVPALAEEIVLDQPFAGASLHEGPLDMVVYFRPIETGAFEVTATFAERDGNLTPRRIVMALEDGDRIPFGIPYHRDATYEFARVGNSLVVSVEAVERTALVK